MEDRHVIDRGGDGSVGTASFIASLVIAAIIALFILQPWDQTSAQRFMTITTQQDRGAQH